MIAAWMLYLCGISLLLGLTAWAAERTLSLSGRPLRWMWVGSLAGSVLLPIAISFSIPRSRVMEGFVSVGAPEIATPAGEISHDLISWFAVQGAAWDGPLLAGWALASLLLASIIALSAYRLHHQRRAWPNVRIGSVDCLVSQDTGPAVVGLLRSAIVLPAWSLDLDPAKRDLLLRHEEEHLRARDPQLLLGALALLVFVPWNLAIWWQVHRLRLAMEVDCDSRVLLRHPSASAYGALLLDVGARRSSVRLAVASFSEPPSFLERRLRMITRNRTRRSWPVLAATAVAITGVLVACGLEQPAMTTQPQPTSPPTVADAAQPEAALEPSFTPYTQTPELRNREDFVAALAAAYPPELKEAGTGGTAVVWVHVDQSGMVTHTRIAQGSGHAEIDEAAVAVLRQAEFTAATLDGRPTAVWIQLPVVFRPTAGEPGN